MIGLASLQSETGQRLLREYGLPAETMDTMVFISGKRAFVRTDAALAVAACLLPGYESALRSLSNPCDRAAIL